MLCIEIKSANEVRADHITSFSTLINDIPNAEGICISQEIRAKQIGNIQVLPWRMALQKYFVNANMVEI